MQEEDSSEFIRLFPEAEIPRIMQLIARACRSLVKKHETEREDDLSDRVFGVLRRMKEIRSAPFVPIREFEVFGDSNTVIGRIDINFVYPGGDTTYFAIEAKRLHVSFPSGWQSLVGEYVTGDQGMMCFVKRKYSKGQKSGAMLGYVFDRNTNKACKLIEAAITNAANQLNLDRHTGFKTNAEIKTEPVTHETCHVLEGMAFTLQHLIVPV